jgi:hypothetical protein
VFHVSAEVVETSNRTPLIPEKYAIGYGAIAPQIENVLRDSLAYLHAVDQVFGTEIDYAQLQKIYGAAPEGPQVRYSPAICMGARRGVIRAAIRF